MPNFNPPSGKPDDGEEGEERKQPYDVEPAARDDGVPSDRTIARFELEGLKAEIDLPGRHAGGLLEVLRWAIGAVLAVAGPSLTINALPETFPAWMTFTLVLIQLAVTAYVVWMFGRGGASRH